MDKRVMLYRKIEVGRKQLPDMDEETFRTMLEVEFGTRSRKDLTVRQLARLVDMLTERGARFVAKPRKRPHVRSDWYDITDGMPMAKERRKICAIWRKLGYDMTSLDERCKRAFGVMTFAWLTNPDHVCTLLNDLIRREKSREKRMSAGA